MVERGPRVPYGDRWLDGFVPDSVLRDRRLVPLETPEAVPGLPDPEGALVDALEKPSTPDVIPSLCDWLTGRGGGDRVVVVVDDHTRPCVHQRRLLPRLLDWLQAHGVPRERIAILVATGTHRAPREEEFVPILGERVWPSWKERVAVHDDREGLEALGAMRDGTPVELDALAASADVLLLLSDLDYHYFAGVSGGPKQLVPGIAGRAIITADHLRMFGELGFAKNVDMGVLDGNPVYEYKREAVRIVLKALSARGRLVYAVICVLNPKGEIVAIGGGDVLGLHRQMRHVLDRAYVARVPRRADVAIVSARHLGINVYQATKAVNVAARAVRPGGSILCLAPCPDGFGNDEFRDLMALAAPILQKAEKRIAGGADAGREGSAAIDRALRVVQEAVVKDYRIGKQKPVDLLVQYRHVGWGNLWFLCDGLSEEDRALLPFHYAEPFGGDAAKRLRAWVEDRERTGRPTYVVIDDPAYWIRLEP